MVAGMETGQWSGKKCYVVGGGPSLKGFDWSTLDGELVIAINRAHEFCEPPIIFGVDPRFFEWTLAGKYGDSARRRLESAILDPSVVVCAVSPSGISLPRGVLDIPNAGVEGLTWSLDDGVFVGRNSGYAALNLAVVLGATEIHLLGFDMTGGPDGNQNHFHDGHPITQPATVYAKFIPYFVKAAPELKAGGVRVINHSRKSAIRCFEFYYEPLEGPSQAGDIYYEGYTGFGDNFHQRVSIKDLASKYRTVYLATAFPEIYWDLPNVQCVPLRSGLRTQTKHIGSLPLETWSVIPPDVKRYEWKIPLANASLAGARRNGYHNTAQFCQGIIGSDYDFSFPLKPEWVEAGQAVLDSLQTNGRPVCIVRRPTVRKEWACETRNPEPEYFQELVTRHRKHYHFVSIADVMEGEEWFTGELKGIHTRFEHGELPLTTIMGLMSLVDMVITYPSLFMLMGIALRAKTFTIWGGHLSPRYHLDPIMGLKNHAYTAPDPACECGKFAHDCNKELGVPEMLDRFRQLRDGDNSPQLQRISEGKRECVITIPAGIGDIYWVALKLAAFKKAHGIDRLTLAIHEDAGHKSSHDFVRMLPIVDDVIDPGIGPKKADWPWNFKVSADERPPILRKDVGQYDYAIEFNTPLECGRRIETVLPEYEIDWDLKVTDPPDGREFADQIREQVGEHLVLFYCSSNGGNAAWAKGKWGVKEWVELAQRIYEYTHCKVVVLGQSWDNDYAELLHNADKYYDPNGNKGVLHFLIGETTIPQAFGLIREAALFVSFPSGLPIMSVHFKTPTVMFWPDPSFRKHWNRNFRTAWVDPERLASGKYKPITYGEPDCTVDGVWEWAEPFVPHGAHKTGPECQIKGHNGRVQVNRDTKDPNDQAKTVVACRPQGADMKAPNVMRFWTKLQAPKYQALLIEDGEIIQRIPDHIAKTPGRWVACIGAWNDKLVVMRKASYELWDKDGTTMELNCPMTLLHAVHAVQQFGDELLVCSSGLDMFFTMRPETGKVTWEWWGFEHGCGGRNEHYFTDDWPIKQISGKEYQVPAADKAHFNSIWVEPGGESFLTASLTRGQAIRIFPKSGQPHEIVAYTNKYGIHSPILVNGTIIYGLECGLRIGNKTAFQGRRSDDSTRSRDWIKFIHPTPFGYALTHDGGVTFTDSEFNVLKEHPLPAPFQVCHIEGVPNA